MTLDEAIQHCEEKARCGDACGLEHKQLAEWLKELKGYRMREETKPTKEDVKKVLDYMLSTPKFDEQQFRKTTGLYNFYVQYSGINDEGKRYSGRKYFDIQKDAEDEMDRLMDDEQNDMVSIHQGNSNHVIKSFTRGY